MPRTAFRIETASEAPTVSFSAATASGLETASQNDCVPSLVASHMSAAMAADHDHEEGRHKAEGQGRSGPVPRGRVRAGLLTATSVNRCCRRPAAGCAP